MRAGQHLRKSTGDSGDGRLGWSRSGPGFAGISSGACYTLTATYTVQQQTLPLPGNNIIGETGGGSGGPVFVAEFMRRSLERAEKCGVKKLGAVVPTSGWTRTSTTL